MKKMIEAMLPLQELNASSIKDKTKKGHPCNMHLWWKRSPIDSSAALLKAALENMPDINDEDAKQRLIDDLQEIAKGRFSDIRKLNNKYPIVCDPFSGFGGLTIAASKLGLKVQSGDLNAVATILTKAATEIPMGFMDHTPVSPKAENKLYFGTEGLAADILYYGDLLKNKVQEKLECYYPKTRTYGAESDKVYAWIWVRTMKCPNPACGCNMPMSTSYILSKTKGHEYWAEPEVHGNKIQFKIHQGICPRDKETNKHGSRGSKFICPACGALTRDEDVKLAGKSGTIGFQLMAICVQGETSRYYVEPDEEQVRASQVPITEDIPLGALPDNTRWFGPPEFGMTEYADLYTPRQMLLMTTLCDLLPDIVEMAIEDARKAGMSDDSKSLEEGGTGVLAYGQAIGVYLALVIGKLVNFQSSICTWDNRKGNVRAAITRQAIPMTWVFAEGNPFSAATGNYSSMLTSVVDVVKNLRGNRKVIVTQQNALEMKFPKNSVLFTELPYYDNVGYADLSDYFYIWLRRCLRSIYPNLFEKVVTSKDELSSIPEHYSGSSSAAIEAYQSGIRQLFRNFYESASEDYPSIVFFEYGKADERSISNGGEDVAPFENFLVSIRDAGFAITGIWPVRTEKANDKFELLRVAVVFRKMEEAQEITRRSFINTLAREIPSMLSLAFEDDKDIEDKKIAGLGLGLQIFTRYKKVMNADGSDMSLHHALQIIYQEVTDLLGEDAVEAETEEV
jgi:putative DNA methylase